MRAREPWQAEVREMARSVERTRDQVQSDPIQNSHKLEQENAKLGQELILVKARRAEAEKRAAALEHETSRLSEISRRMSDELTKVRCKSSSEVFESNHIACQSRTCGKC